MKWDGRKGRYVVSVEEFIDKVDRKNITGREREEQHHEKSEEYKKASRLCS